jgi:hypothetical protein
MVRLHLRWSVRCALPRPAVSGWPLVGRLDPLAGRAGPHGHLLLAADDRHVEDTLHQGKLVLQFLHLLHLVLLHRHSDCLDCLDGKVNS